MTFLFLFAVLLAAGLFFIFADVLKLPTMGAAKAMLSAGKQSKKTSKTLEAYLMSGAVKLSKIIRMDEYKRSRMQNVLKAAGIAMTPEIYTAYAIVKAGAILLGVIPCLLLFPLLSPVLVFLSVLVYFKEIRKADEQLKAKREQIESELPRFVATVEQELKNSRDVADDRNDSYSRPNVPSNPQTTSSSWGVWRPKWHANWIWQSDWNWCSDGKGGGHWRDDGHWVDRGWWDFDYCCASVSFWDNFSALMFRLHNINIFRASCCIFRAISI